MNIFDILFFITKPFLSLDYLTYYYLILFGKMLFNDY